MEKVRRQEHSLSYAMDYMEHLLDMEEVMDRKIDQAVRKYMEKRKKNQL